MIISARYTRIHCTSTLCIEQFLETVHELLHLDSTMYMKQFVLFHAFQKKNNSKFLKKILNFFFKEKKKKAL